MSDPEIAVLGAAILSTSAADLLVETLQPGDYSTHARGLLHAAIADLRSDGMPADPATLTELMGRRGTLDEVGGPVTFHNVSQGCPSPSQADHYARLVARQARARRIAARMTSAPSEVAEVDDLDGYIDGLVSDLLADQAGGTVVDKAAARAEMFRQLETGEVTSGVELGWSMPLRLREDGLHVVTGLPSSGKSTWLDCAIYNVLRANDGWKVAYFSPEQAPASDHLDQLTWTALKQDPRRAPRERVEAAADWWLGRVEWLDDARDNTPSAILSTARKLRKGGCRILVVDPYNNLEPDVGGRRHEREQLYIAELLRRFRRFARETRTAVVMVAHPRQPDVVPGTEAVFRMPTAAHIAGGQEWWNHSDAMVCVWRNQSGESPDVHGTPFDVKIAVQKVRRARFGGQGIRRLRFDPSARSYFDPAY